MIFNFLKSFVSKNTSTNDGFFEYATKESTPMELKIYKDNIIRNKFFGGYERTTDISWYVIHGTSGGGTLDWMRNTKPNSDRGKKYQKGIALFHYLIEEDGKIWEIIPPNKWVWHSATGSTDKGTIGVEMLNKSIGNTKPYTPSQYVALLALYTYLKENITICKNMDVMISHNRAKQKITGKSKSCPGKGFDWKLWRGMVSEYYTFAHENGEHLWNIKKI